MVEHLRTGNIMTKKDEHLYNHHCDVNCTGSHFFIHLECTTYECKYCKMQVELPQSYDAAIDLTDLVNKKGAMDGYKKWLDKHSITEGWINLLMTGTGDKDAN